MSNTMRSHRYPRFEGRSLFRGPTWTQLGVVAFLLLFAFAAIRVGALWLAVVLLVVAVLPVWPLGDGMTIGTRVAEGWRYLARMAFNSRGDTSDLTVQEWPRPVGRLQVAAVDLPGGQQAGVAVDRGRHMAALRLAAPAAAALQTDDQADQLADDFDQLIRTLPPDVVDRVQVLLVARHGGGDELRQAAAGAEGPDAAAAVVREAAEAIATSVRHVEAIVVVRLALKAQKSAAKLGGDGEVRQETVRAAMHVADAVSGGATSVVGLLAPDEWCGLLERHLDPLSTDRSLADPPSWPPPVTAVHDGWREAWTGESCHRSWWVAQWPQMPVLPGWWAPVLSAGQDLVVSMLIIPDDALRSQSRMQLSYNRLASSIATRKGRSIVKERELERLEEQLGDLADGHVPTTCVATVTVTGRDPQELDRAGLRLSQATTRARVRLGELHGRQLDGWEWSLPLCRGLGG
jgi:hypothetical protein